MSDNFNKHAGVIENGTLLGTDTPAIVQKLFQPVQPTSVPTSIPNVM
jgi:hypothetical protein